ncbi:MAG: site-specific integrase, partial [Bryobacteraceae bacterium]|nr:site-specific integrase [Bryobacteraceae bacterium]
MNDEAIAPVCAIPAAKLEAFVDAFLAFCRIEKGLAKNTLDAYRRDLNNFSSFC